MKDKTICIISPSLKMGGVERASSNVANYFSSEGCDVTFVSIFPQEVFFYIDSKVHFFEPEINKKKLEIIKTIFWIRKTVKEVKPRVVLVFGVFYGAVIRLALAGIKIPIIISNRNSPTYQCSWYVALFQNIVYRVLPPSGVIAQTAIAADCQKKLFGKRSKIKIIPNILREIRHFPEVERQKKILAVGRLDDRLKGFDRLIQAFSKIKNKDWKLIFAGGCETADNLKQLVKNFGVDDRVEFLGKVKDIDRVYAQAGLFVIPSRSEGFPNALCEAMAAGLPCISFDFVAGPRDIIRDGHDGILVENGNIKKLAEKIDFLIENEKERERLGRNALLIKERFSSEKIGKEYLNFILNCQLYDPQKQ